MLSNISSNSWQKEVLDSEKPTVVVFWHQKCPYCLQMQDALDGVSKKYGQAIKFLKFDIRESDENFHFALNMGIMATPVLKFFRKSNEVGEIVGYMPEDQLREAVEEILKRAEECLRKSSPVKED